MTDNYSNREIDSHFKEIKETLCRIEAQTVKTNGRVNILEDKVINITTSGKVANWAFGITVPVIVAMVVWVFFNQLEAIRIENNYQREVIYSKLEAINNNLR